MVATSLEGKSRNLDDLFTIRAGETFLTFRIVELVPEKRVMWQVTDCYLIWLRDKTEWTGTKIVWEISSSQNPTRVDMTHVGLVPGLEGYNDCKVGWDGNIQKSLFRFLTENKEMPDEF